MYSINPICSAAINPKQFQSQDFLLSRYPNATLYTKLGPIFNVPLNLPQDCSRLARDKNAFGYLQTVYYWYKWSINRIRWASGPKEWRQSFMKEQLSNFDSTLILQYNYHQVYLCIYLAQVLKVNVHSGQELRIAHYQKLHSIILQSKWRNLHWNWNKIVTTSIVFRLKSNNHMQLTAHHSKLILQFIHFYPNRYLKFLISPMWQQNRFDVNLKNGSRPGSHGNEQQFVKVLLLNVCHRQD